MRPRRAAFSSSPETHRHGHHCVKREEWSYFRCKAEDCVLAEMVSWVVAGSPKGITVSWPRKHVALLGRPEHAKVTGESNPFSRRHHQRKRPPAAEVHRKRW